MDIDYSKLFPAQNHGVKHGPFLPKNMFCVIAGATGCGKTNLMLNFLLNEKVLDYDDIYIYTSTLHQPAYVYLKKYYNDLENTIKVCIESLHKIAKHCIRNNANVFTLFHQDDKTLKY